MLDIKLFFMYNVKRKRQGISPSQKEKKRKEKTMLKLNKTFAELSCDSCFKNYVVKCDSAKYATAITADGVYVCFYGSVALDNIKE